MKEKIIVIVLILAFVCSFIVAGDFGNENHMDGGRATTTSKIILEANNTTGASYSQDADEADNSTLAQPNMLQSEESISPENMEVDAKPAYDLSGMAMASTILISSLFGLVMVIRANSSAAPRRRTIRT